MEESQLPSSPEPAPTARMSLGSRLFNVFVEPGAVFQDIKANPPSHLNWILPLICTILAACIYAVVVFSSPAILQELTNTQHQKMEEMVKAGKLTQQQADQAEANLDKVFTPTVRKIMGIGGAVLGNAFSLVLGALILFLVARFALRSPISFPRSLEVAGLSCMITALSMIMAMGLAVKFESMLATPGPVLLVHPIATGNRLHSLLSALNLMTIWQLAVASIGLGTVCNVKTFKPALWLFGIWAVLTFGTIFAFTK